MIETLVPSKLVDTEKQLLDALQEMFWGAAEHDRYVRAADEGFPHLLLLLGAGEDECESHAGLHTSVNVPLERKRERKKENRVGGTDM